MAEWVARQLWLRRRKPSYETAPPTRFTQSRKREAKGAPSRPPAERMPRPLAVCRTCGKDIKRGRSHCAECAVGVATEHITQAARAARVRAHSPEARAKQSDTQRRHRKAAAAWSPSSQPDWLTEKVYLEKIQPALASLSNSAIASWLGVSRCCASRIRSGPRIRKNRRNG